MLGTAVLWREGETGQVAAIDNLSEGGALVSAPTGVEPETWIHVLLCLPGSAAASVLARVVRCEPIRGGGVRIALAFDHLQPNVQESLALRVARVLERQDAEAPSGPRGLVVGPETVDRDAMVAQLKTLGYSVLAVDSVPEAVQYLGQQPAPFEFVAVDAMSECAEGVDLLAMAHRIYPTLRCVLIGDSADPGYLARECEFLERSEVLLRPWTPDDLRRAIRGASRG